MLFITLTIWSLVWRFPDRSQLRSLHFPPTTGASTLVQGQGLDLQEGQGQGFEHQSQGVEHQGQGLTLGEEG